MELTDKEKQRIKNIFTLYQDGEYSAEEALFDLEQLINSEDLDACEVHTWVLQMNMPNLPTRNVCEECGAVEDTDPEDVAEQLRILANDEA